MKDPIVQALAEVADALIQRGVVATPVDGGLLLRLAPVEGQATVDETNRKQPGSVSGALRKSW